MSGGPMRQVLDAITAGATGHRAICERTGLGPGMVEAALDQLERMNMLEREEVGSACPSDGCGSCGSASTCVAPATGRGPVFLTLRRRTD